MTGYQGEPAVVTSSPLPFPYSLIISPLLPSLLPLSPARGPDGVLLATNVIFTILTPENMSGDNRFSNAKRILA